MTDVINLNKARKAKEKAKEKQKADANRVLHGLTKDAKKKALAEIKIADKALDGKKLKD